MSSPKVSRSESSHLATKPRKYRLASCKVSISFHEWYFFLRYADGRLYDRKPNRTASSCVCMHREPSCPKIENMSCMYVRFPLISKFKPPHSPQPPKARKTYRHRATVEFGTAGALGRELDDLSSLLLHGRLCPLQRCGPLEEVVRGLRIRPLVPITASHEGRRLILGGHCFQAVRGYVWSGSLARWLGCRRSVRGKAKK